MHHSEQHSYLTDEELLKRYQQSKDNQWLGYLLQRYTLLLLGVAMKYLKEKSSAEDAVQHVFYKALTHLPQGEIRNFKGWLYVLTRNHCLQILRDKNYPLSEESLARMASPEDESEALKWKDYTLEQMNEALKELNEEQEKTLRLFYIERQSYQQIMDRTGFSYMQVKSFIQNGKRNLKLILIKKLGNRKP